MCASQVHKHLWDSKLKLKVYTYSKELKKSIPGFISIIDIHSLHQGDNRYPMAKFLTLICKEQGQKLTINQPTFLHLQVKENR